MNSSYTIYVNAAEELAGIWRLGGKVVLSCFYSCKLRKVEVAVANRSLFIQLVGVALVSAG